MKKLLSILFVCTLFLGACGNSPQQKAKDLEQELDAEFEEKGQDTDYSFYYDEVSNLLETIKNTEDSFSEVDSYLDDAQNEEEPEFKEWDINMAVREVEQMNLDIENEIDFFLDEIEKDEDGYTILPKDYQKFNDDVIKSIKKYNQSLKDYSKSIGNENIEEYKEKAISELNNLDKHDNDLEKLRKIAHDN